MTDRLTNLVKARSYYWRFLVLTLCLLPALCQAQPQYTISTVVGSCSAAPCSGGFAGDNGAATSAQLNGPFGIIFDTSGNLYIADSNNNRVRKVANGTISTVAGNGTQGFSGDNGSATSAELWAPSAITFDGSGNMYIADTGNFEVRKVSGGNITTFAGKQGSGAGYGGDLGPATSALLDNPSGLAVDSSGNVYITDPGANVIRVVCANQTPIACTSNTFGSVTFAAGDINTIAGNHLTGAGYQGDGGLANGALVNNPVGMAMDSAGNLYFADSNNNAIRKIAPNGVITTVAGGDGVPAYKGDGGPATKAELNTPKGVAVDSSNNIYIADTYNSVIRMVTTDGIIHTIAGNQSAGPGFSGDGGAALSAQLFFPSGVAVSAGKIYIADYQNNVIRMLTPIVQVPVVNPGGVVNGGSFTAPVAAGSIASVFGSFFLTSTEIGSTIPLQTNLEGLSFDFGGTATPLFFVSGGQANVQVPWELAGKSSTTITPTLNSTAGSGQSVTLAEFAPAIFTMNSQGTGQGAVLDTNYKLVDSSNPATAGSTVIQIYCTGLGPVSSNQPATGAPASLTDLAHTSTDPIVTIGGIQASVSFSGLAPGFVGLYQVNATVPAGIAASNSVPVMISIGNVNSNTATIAVQ